VELLLFMGLLVFMFYIVIVGVGVIVGEEDWYMMDLLFVNLVSRMCVVFYKLFVMCLGVLLFGVVGVVVLVGEGLFVDMGFLFGKVMVVMLYMLLLVMVFGVLVLVVGGFMGYVIFSWVVLVVVVIVVYVVNGLVLIVLWFELV